MWPSYKEIHRVTEASFKKIQLSDKPRQVFEGNWQGMLLDNLSPQSSAYLESNWLKINFNREGITLRTYVLKLLIVTSVNFWANLRLKSSLVENGCYMSMNIVQCSIVHGWQSCYLWIYYRNISISSWHGYYYSTSKDCKKYHSAGEIRQIFAEWAGQSYYSELLSLCAIGSLKI